MPKEYSRTLRVGDQIQRELAEILRKYLKDPRLNMVTINAVEVSKDLSHAKVFVTSLNEPEERTKVIEILNHASAFLKRQLGKCMRIRTIPHLHFCYDESVEHGSKMESLINEAVALDRQKASEQSTK